MADELANTAPGELQAALRASLHQAANQTSVVHASLEYLRPEWHRLPLHARAALEDATVAAEALVASLREVQRLVG